MGIASVFLRRDASVMAIAAIALAIDALGSVHGRVLAQELCAECLAVVPDARLSTADGPITPSLSQSVAATTDEFLVSHLFLRDPQIARYDRMGRFIALYEASGSGPGEFRTGSISLAVGRADTVYAFEESRLSRFVPGMEHVDTKNSDMFLQGTPLVLPAGGMVVHRMVPADDSSLHRVHVLNPEGRLLRSLEPVMTRAAGARIAQSASGGFWTLPTNDLWLREYTADGDSIRSVRIRDSDFEPWTELLPGERWEVRPQHRLHAGLLDAGDDTLIVLKYVPDPEWTPTPRSGGVRVGSVDRSSIYDTVVELVDAATGRIIASERLGELLATVDGSDRLLYSTETDEMGHVITRIWRVEIRPGTPQH